jgi:hypothetical protein
MRGIETFNPNMPMTTAMVAQVLYNHAGQSYVRNLRYSFLDVPEDAWYRDAAIWMVGALTESKIIENTFNGDEYFNCKGLLLF